jgi:hypothetical protein
MAAMTRVLFFIFFPLIGLAQTIRYDHSLPSAVYAAERLQKALAKKSTPNYTIRLIIDSTLLGAESYSIDPGPQNSTITGQNITTTSQNITTTGQNITITGGDARGLIYGSLALAEAVGNDQPLTQLRPTTEQPHLPFRAIKFDLPWDTYRHSYALDQHITTCRDTLFWQAFLDMMVDNRFNALTLWNLHPYPFMIRARNFPEACPFSDAELKEWQTLFHSIFRMARQRCIDTYLIPFNIFVSPEFARAHQVALDNLSHHFFVNGDTAGIIKRYTRESVTQVLQEYPELSGFGLTLGEGMGGMTPQQREDWMKETIVAGMQAAGRKTKLIHRIPFSGGTGSLGVTSLITEQLTRKAIDEEGDLPFLEGPVWADLKYNWSHPLSTTKLIKVHGGKLYDTYFKPAPASYRIVWTARNEDFFCLRWGVPDFIRAHLAVNNQSYVGGYFIGSETYIPAKDYFTALPGPVDWRYAFQRQWLFYKLWGRLLYDPATPDSIFRAEFIRRYGRQAGPLLEAAALAGKTPLRLGSDFDFTWDFSLYSEGFLALDTTTKRVDYISVDRLIHQPPADPDYISVAAYVDGILAGASFSPQRITPLILADQLEKDCRRALALVKGIGDPTAAGTPTKAKNLSLRYEVADIRTWSWLGLHFAHQLRGAVALQYYRRTGHITDQQQAIAQLQAALKDWDKVVAITRPIYMDMPLTHLSEQDGVRSKENAQRRWHWAMTRPDVARDIDIARKAVPGK